MIMDFLMGAAVVAGAVIIGRALLNLYDFLKGGDDNGEGLR